MKLTRFRLYCVDCDTVFSSYHKSISVLSYYIVSGITVCPICYSPNVIANSLLKSIGRTVCSLIK